MRHFLDDLRISGRRLLQRPGFTVLVCLVVGLGIGANAVVFSFFYGVVLRPLPFVEPERLVLLWSANPASGVDREAVSYPDFLDWRARSETLDLAALGSWRFTLTAGGEPERLSTLVVSPELFDLLGVRPRLGRVFRPDEATPGRDRVVLLSHGLWQRRFAASPDVVGSSVELNGEPYEVVGVLPADFRFPTSMVELWKPMAFPVEEMPRGSRWLQVVGRLAPGASLEQAGQEMAAIAAGIRAEDPQHAAGWEVGMTPLHEAIVGKLRPALVLLQALLALVVLITCANVANLVLARSRSQQSEMAVRLALGANRWRLLSSVLAENLLLSALGGAVGALLAFVGVRWILALLPAEADATTFGEVTGHSFPRLDDVRVDGWVLAFTVALCLVMSLVLTVVAAVQSNRSGLQEALVTAGRVGQRGGSRRLVRSLIVGEVTAALVLLIGAGLLSRSFMAVVRVDPGFRSERVLTMEVSLRQFEAELQRVGFIDRLLRELRSLPGIEAVGFSTAPPFTGGSWDVDFRLVGGPAAADPSERPRGVYQSADAGYFETLRIPLRRGRLFDEHDTALRHGVAVVNEALVRRYGGGEDLLGERIVVGEGDGVEYEIVGVVGDALQSGLDTTPVPELFFPYTQGPPWYLRLVVRTSGDPESAIASIKRRIWDLDPGMTFRNVFTVDELIGNSLVQRRLQVTLVDAAGALALVLAMMGIYAMIVHSVVERRHEIGVRMALGAERSHVTGMIVREALGLTLAGIALGIVLSFPVTKLLSRLLFGVSATDMVTFAAAPLVLLAVALLASYLPARRALRVQPAEVLRHE